MGNSRCYACVTQGGCLDHRKSTRNNGREVDGLNRDRLYYEAVLWELDMAMDRSKAGGDLGLVTWMDEVFSLEHPHLFEFMTETSWSDGKPRKVGTLLLVAEGKVIKCSLHDRDGRRAAWITAESLQELLRRVDKGLEFDTLDWRKDTR